jgi:hypothetical protein
VAKQSRAQFLRAVLGVSVAALAGPAAVARALELEDAPVAAAPTGLPVGAVIQFVGQRPPDGMLLCYGQTLPKDEFPDLYAAIGDRYGRATRSRFTLPDFRGRVVEDVETIGESDGIALAERRLYRPSLSTSATHYASTPPFISADCVIQAR